MVPRKQAADITLNAIAHAPQGQITSSWPTSVRVGRATKQLRITGPRYWKFGLLRGWHLSQPAPATEVPIRYENAFGGSYEHQGEQVVFEANPVGCGFASAKAADSLEKIPGPQIEDPNNPIEIFGKEYAPAGFGPIAKHCTPRRSLCGTADADWQSTRRPLRPLDFDFRYYNCAPKVLLHRQVSRLKRYSFGQSKMYTLPYRPVSQKHLSIRS